MRSLAAAAVIVTSLAFEISARADAGTTSLDDVETGHTRSLDDVDTGRTRSLDSVDTGETIDQDALDVGHTTSLDAADTGSTVDFDSVDTGRTESLGEAERAPAPPPSLPAPLPPIANDALREKAVAAHAELVAAEHRSAAANAAYSEMRAHDFPRGQAAAAIEKEYAEARVAYDQANARYTEILQQVSPASIGN